ncbi:MAG: hypothetical protein ACK5N2_03620 [bacterium]|jgi:hypothetical protein
MKICLRETRNRPSLNVPRIIEIGVITLMSLSSLAPAYGSTLTPSVKSNTLTKLDVSWVGDFQSTPEGDQLLPIPPGLANPETNWEITKAVIKYSLLGGGRNDVSIKARHKTNPHPKLGEKSGGQEVSFSFSFIDFMSSSGKETKTVDHPPLHKDFYTLVHKFDFTPPTADTPTKRLLFIHREGVHTPEPNSTLSLLLLGVIGMSSLFCRKMRG